MRKRLIVCIAGGLAGIVLAFPLNSSLELPRSVATVGCSLAGAVIGYLVSVLIEVFAADAKESDVQGDRT
jgi:hypothetical protein